MTHRLCKHADYQIVYKAGRKQYIVQEKKLARTNPEVKAVLDEKLTGDPDY